MKEIEKKEYETNMIVWMLIWREFLWQIPCSLILIPVLFSILLLPDIVVFVLAMLISLIILVVTTKLAFNGMTKKAIVRKDQVKGVSLGYLLVFLVTGLQNLESPDVLSIVSIIIQLAVAYLYIKRLLNKVAV